MNNFLKVTCLAALCIICTWAGAAEPTEPRRRASDVQQADTAVRPAPQPYPGQRDPSRPLPPRNNLRNRPRQLPDRYQPGRTDAMASRRRVDSNKKKEEIFLDHLRKENPSEADRFQQLQQTDPKGFVQAVKQRLDERKLELALQKYPQIMEAVAALPRMEREEAVRILVKHGSTRQRPQGKKAFHIQGLPGVSDAASKGASDPRPAGDAKRDEATFELARTYQASRDPAERKRLDKEIQTQLKEIFDTREAYQKKQVAKIEATLKELKIRIKTRQTHRDEIIERRRQELIGAGDSLSW